MGEIFVSTDVEANGPIPGAYSMLSLASVALRHDGAELGRFAANLEELPGAGRHPDTMAWWKGFPEAWAACRADPEEPSAVMQRYAAWLDALPGPAVFVGYPATWDFGFVYWYLIRFVGRSPFGHSALDVKTLAMSLLGLPFRSAVKRNFPDGWKDDGLPHTHVAMDDALEQGRMFLAMMREVWERRR
ncbi:MAG: hypothetical protein Fur0037_06760 [Planctomycetota bacterium]